MIKKLLVIFIFSSIVFFIFPSPMLAVEDPLAVPNNKFGIHILFPDELKDAAPLVNSRGGDWGYVIIPIQTGDKNIEKWQAFMDDAKRLHLIPILRLASEGDYFNTKVWRKPNYDDVLDFANFLNSLTWPTKNRYIAVFNEVNRGDEWGGSPDPAEYAQLLSYASTVFKSRNNDFFIISAGLDSAAPNKPGEYINAYDYLVAMNKAIPGIFFQVDGLGSHSYPNPGFAQPPSYAGKNSISSFLFEKELIKSLGSKDLPVFITETGWSQEAVKEELIASYFQEAFSTVWNNDKIVAITPFLLRSGAGPFTQFSFLKIDGSPTLYYKTIESLPKEKGKPVLNQGKIQQKVLGTATHTKSTSSKDSTIEKHYVAPQNFSFSIHSFLKWLLKLQI